MTTKFPQPKQYVRRPTTKRRTVQLTTDLCKRWEAMAKQTGFTKSQIVSIALQDILLRWESGENGDLTIKLPPAPKRGIKLEESIA